MRVVVALGVASGLFAGWMGLVQVSHADDTYQNKTIELRSGKVTLQPSQPAPPAQSRSADGPPPAVSPPPGASTPAMETAPAAGPAPIHPQNSSRWRSAPPATSPAPPPGQAASPAPADDPARRPGAATRSAASSGTPITAERMIVSLERRITETERINLAQNGIYIGEYLGQTNYNARITHKTVEELVRASQGINKVLHAIALDESNASIKVDPALSGRIGAPDSGPRGGGPTAERAPPAGPTTGSPATANVVVQLWPEADIEQVRRELAPLGEIVRVSPRTRKIEMSVPKYENVGAIAKLKGVQYLAPSYSVKSQNTHVRRSMGVDIAADAPHALTGNGVKVGVWDGGHVAAQHPSFAGRLAVDLIRENTRRRDNQHATHVAGTIAGSGEFVVPLTSSGSRVREGDMPAFGDELTIKQRPRDTTRGTRPAVAADADPLETRYPGVAPASQLVSFDFFGAAEELVGLLIEKPDAIDVVNNSWTLDLNPTRNPGVCNQVGTYIMDAAEFDAAISGGRPGQEMRRIPVLFAAGNSRDDSACGMSSAPGFPNFRTVLPPSTAKNVITVGAVDSDTDAMTDFSNWGPTASGRLKPDVVAPGCRQFADGERGILSAVPATGVGRMCGTSMATPAVTGMVALLIEKMGKLGVAKTDVYPSTYKALIIHGAKDLGRPGPDFEYGYGLVKIGPTLKLIDDRAFEQLRLDNEGQTHIKDLVIPQGTQELKVTLTWDDRPTGSFTDEALANDLDLRLVSPTGEAHLPLVLNAAPGRESELARPNVDRLNVVEQVLVVRPAAGTWKVEIRAHKIGSPTGGQTYSVVTSFQ
jgi:hypothetical protein